MGEVYRVVNFHRVGNSLASSDRNTVELHVWESHKGCAEGNLPREKLQAVEFLVGSVGAKWFFMCPQLAIAYMLSSKRTDGKTQTFPTLCEPHFPWSYPKVAWLDDQTLVSTREYRYPVMGCCTEAHTGYVIDG